MARILPSSFQKKIVSLSAPRVAMNSMNAIAAYPPITSVTFDQLVQERVAEIDCPINIAQLWTDIESHHSSGTRVASYYLANLDGIRADEIYAHEKDKQNYSRREVFRMRLDEGTVAYYPSKLDLFPDRKSVV